MPTTEMVLFAHFLKTSKFNLPAYLYIYYLWPSVIIIPLNQFTVIYFITKNCLHKQIYETFLLLFRLLSRFCKVL